MFLPEGRAGKARGALRPAVWALIRAVSALFACRVAAFSPAPPPCPPPAPLAFPFPFPFPPAFGLTFPPPLAFPFGTFAAAPASSARLEARLPFFADGAAAALDVEGAG